MHELIVDSLLMTHRRYSIVANYLYRNYPTLRVSYLSAIRQRIVQNTTLAKFATMYKMEQALELGEGYEKLRQDTKGALYSHSILCATG
jgi:dsRNA-specific ribonuclease